jgi:hypothetical protein
MAYINISIAKDFSSTPGPRYIKEGDNSGELFRQTIFLPKMKQAIQENKILFVDLDGVFGYGTSFLEETFGGLIRDADLDYHIVLKHLKIKSEEEPFLIEDINNYLKDAYDQKAPKHH